MALETIDLGGTITAGSLASGLFSIGGLRFQTSSGVTVTQTGGALRFQEAVATGDFELTITEEGGDGQFQVERATIDNMSTGGDPGFGAQISVAVPGSNTSVPQTQFTGVTDIDLDLLDSNTIGTQIRITDVEINGNANRTIFTLDNIQIDLAAFNNRAPSFNAGTSATLTLNEDSGATGLSNLLNITDADTGNSLTWSIFSGPSYGSLGGFNATGSSNGGSVAPAGLTYTPTADYSGADSFVVQVSDGAATDTLTVNVTVTPVNDAPLVSNLNGDSITHTVGRAAALLDIGSDSIVTDIDSTNFDGGTLTVAVTNLIAAEDLLTLDTTSNVALSGTMAGATVSIAGNPVGTLADAIAAGNDLVINLNAAATPSNLPSLLRALQYQNTDSVSPDITARTVNVTLSDGDGSTAAASTVTVNLQIAPEIDILGNGMPITAGDTTPSTADDTDFGPQSVETDSTVNIFTINNLGTDDLILLGSPFVQLSDDTHFTVTAQPDSFASVGGSTPFAITFDPTAPGFHTATVTVTSNDSDEGTYTFDIQGYGQPFLVINEIDVDNPGTDDIEFIELYDGGLGNTALDGLVLVLYDGTNDQSYHAIDLDGQTTNAEGYFVIGSAAVPNVDGVEFISDGLQNGADAVALYYGDAADFPNDTPVRVSALVDAVVYGTNDADDAGLLPLLTAGNQLNEDENGQGPTQSLQRFANGSGGQRNTNAFITATPTPGTANLPSFQFAAKTFTSAEGVGISNGVTVTRTSSVGNAAVQVAIEPSGTATENSDYNNTGFPVTVNFAEGETSKTVAIPIFDDATIEGDETIALGLFNPSNGTLGDLVTATLTITDNDSPGFTITESSDRTTVEESGTTDTFTVVLNSQPLSNVKFAIASNRTHEVTAAPTTLAFTSANWNIAQAVTVTGVDEAQDDDDQTSTITVSVVAADSDDTFDALADQTVTVTTTDDDIAGITLTESAGSTAVTAGGATDSYTLVLHSQPTDTVTITLASDGQTQLDQTVITFTTANWAQAQAVTVMASDDIASQGNRTSTISSTVASLDNQYDGLALAPVTVAVTDAANPIFNFEQWVSRQAILTGKGFQSDLVDFNVEIGGLRIAPIFDETDYLSQYHDVALAVQQGDFNYGFEHFVLYGVDEGRSPSSWFDRDYYLAQNADVAASVNSGNGSAIDHFLQFGHREERDPSAFFDTDHYLLNHPDVKAAVAIGALDSPFEH